MVQLFSKVEVKIQHINEFTKTKEKLNTFKGPYTSWPHTGCGGTNPSNPFSGSRKAKSTFGMLSSSLLPVPKQYLHNIDFRGCILCDSGCYMQENSG